MRICVTQIYIRVGVNFPFSHLFQKWLADALTQRVSPSDYFLNRYSAEYCLVFNVSAKAEIKAPEIVGPSVFKKTHDVEYTVFLPFDRDEDYERTGYRRVMAFLFEGIVAVLRGLRIDTSTVEQDMASLIEFAASDPIMTTKRKPLPPTNHLRRTSIKGRSTIE